MLVSFTLHDKSLASLEIQTIILDISTSSEFTIIHTPLDYLRKVYNILLDEKLFKSDLFFTLQDIISPKTDDL